MRPLRTLLAAAGALAVLLAAPAAFAADSVTVTLSTENNSGEAGTATLTAMGDQTQVVIHLSNAPATGQPAHIHQGQCGPTLNPVPKFPLANVTNGTSTTMVNAKLADLTGGDMAINVHKSASDLQTYVACGNIAAVAAASATTPTAAPATGGGYAGTRQEELVAVAAALGGALTALALSLRRRLAR